jgi:transposase
MKRKWTSIQTLETQLLKLREAGMTRQEIANELGLTKQQIKDWINRYNHRQKSLPVVVKQRGRPRKRPIGEPEAMALRIRELEHEVELYRSFLQVVGRM